MTPFQHAVQGLNPRQVAYCRYRVQGIATIESFLKAGYKQGTKTTMMATIAKMNGNPKIKHAIVALQEIANTRSEVTREQLVGYLLEHREVALEDNQIGAANAAVMGVAKMMGLEVNRSEVNVTHSYEVEQATQELFNMLSRRGTAPVIEGTVNDAE